MIEVLGIPNSQRGNMSDNNHKLEHLMDTIADAMEKATGTKNPACIFFPCDMVQKNLGQELVFRIIPLGMTHNGDELEQIVEHLRQILKKFARENLPNCKTVVGFCVDAPYRPSIMIDGTV